ncbi:hypothetical protein C7I87_33955 [Mesorhizobium sp. SARCC-RB16n]|uniref:hypothetical protein n=1 Tax=Mesorhizobium sp. SARCC-RB16n TaxID=2116687 RepID=UPI00122F5A82|nr:hypothetical protein [Mesorhizobium sp. SARCC-RB16n]KAA3441876.1 hypothetical protein C7I87_33955 [Mesorhizobium sp. SARCC-RB16n]
MDSLTIQDAFEPYYADRNRASPRHKRLPAKSGPTREPAAVTLPTNVKLSDNKPDSTTEH